MADSSINEESSLETTTAMQATSECSSEPIIAVEKSHENGEEVKGLSEEETSNNVEQNEQDQQTYANLEPILVAMELGQEILQGTGSEVDDDEEEATVVQMEVQHDDTTTESNVVAITQEQLASLFANSGTANGGNVIVTSLPSDGTTTQGGLSLATILQDVVSGIHHNNSNGAATVLTDSSGNSGSYYLVTQGGTIPIVMPSNTSGMNLVQTSSTDQTTFVTVNQDSLPEGVEVMPATDHTTDGGVGGSSHMSAGTSVDSSGIQSEPITETVSSDHELASAAAAVENDTPEALQEAIASPVPILTTSVKRRLSNGPRVCEQCNKAFKYPSDLKKHLQIHTDIKKFKCDACNRFFRRLHQLVVHKRIHSGEKPYSCTHCGTAFRHDSTLTMHVRTRHEHKRPFKCTYCDHTFGRLSHLRKHVKKVCGPNKQEKQASAVCQCKFCEEVFPTKVDLRKHTSICEKKESKAKQPSQVALHVCNICNKDFASPYNVRRHQLTHSDDRPFECEYCNKSFKEKSSLTKHVKRVHLGKSKDDDDEDEEDETGELVEVVSMSTDELTASLQTSSSSENNNTTTTVDSSALVQVAASVMVEELMHGENEASTTVASSDVHQHMFIAETEKPEEGYDGQLGSSVMDEASASDALCLENTHDSSDQADSSQFEEEAKPNHEIEECDPAMVLDNDRGEEVVTSSENGQVSL